MTLNEVVTALSLAVYARGLPVTGGQARPPVILGLMDTLL